MGRSHDHYCVKCKSHWSPFDFTVCPGCDTDEHSGYDLNHDLGDSDVVAVSEATPVDD